MVKISEELLKVYDYVFYTYNYALPLNDRNKELYDLFKTIYTEIRFNVYSDIKVTTEDIEISSIVINIQLTDMVIECGGTYYLINDLPVETYYKNNKNTMKPDVRYAFEFVLGSYFCYKLFKKSPEDTYTYLGFKKYGVSYGKFLGCACTLNRFVEHKDTRDLALGDNILSKMYIKPYSGLVYKILINESDPISISGRISCSKELIVLTISIYRDIGVVRKGIVLYDGKILLNEVNAQIFVSDSFSREILLSDNINVLKL